MNKLKKLSLFRKSKKNNIDNNIHYCIMSHKNDVFSYCTQWIKKYIDYSEEKYLNYEIKCATSVIFLEAWDYNNEYQN